MKPIHAYALLLVGCATTSEVTVPQEDPSSHRRVQEQSTLHKELLERLADAPAAHVESCRSTAGDCLFQISDRRSQLVSRLRLNACEDSDDFQSKSRCFVSQLEKSAPRELGDYLAAENWCFKQLTDCTTEKAEAASRATLEALAAARMQEVEAAPAAQAARSEALATRARIVYLRATLPPDVAACAPDAEAKACGARVEDARQALDESLRRDDYAPSTAASSYVALQGLEASCVRPELTCLSSLVRSYGVFPESRKWVDRNLELLGKRQELVARVSPENGERCLSEQQQQHQANIVSAYVVYVREPVLYFRTQLDKAFLTLHQAQVSCLQAKPQNQRSKPAVAAQH
jgi:hypothetical protein